MHKGGMLATNRPRAGADRLPVTTFVTSIKEKTSNVACSRETER
jgi:hypothetical protein